MGYDIVLGRNKSDYNRLGTDASMLLGKHYVTMGKTTSLANNIYLDVNNSHVVLIAGKRGSGKCLHGDTRITLDNGVVKKIKELEDDENNIMGLDDDLKIKPLIKEGFYKRKVNKLLKVKLRSGKEIKLTPEHPLLTVKGWVPVRELKEGSRIATPRRANSFGTEEMPEHEVKLLAYLIAEGHLSNGFVLFSNTSDELVTEFKQCVKLFDDNLKIRKHGVGSYRVSQENKNYEFTEEDSVRDEKGRFIKSGTKPSKSSLTKWLIELNAYNRLALEKRVPDEIFKLPKYQLALFLNRLFTCDGSVYKHKAGNRSFWEISYSSSSKELIQQVQHLLLRYDIQSKLREKTIKTNGKCFLTYELMINRVNLLKFAEEIGFFSTKKELQEQAVKESINVESNPNVDTIPKQVWDLYTPSNWAEVGRRIGYKTGKSLRNSVNYSPSRQKLAQISLIDGNQSMYKLATSDIFWDEIVNVTELKGEFTVYDTSVPEHHNFVANDVIVHNSYTMGVMAEAVLNLPEDVKEDIGMIFFDTMGLYWTTKYSNYKQARLLEEWGLEPKTYEDDVTVYCPKGYFDYYKENNIPVDKPFTVNPADLSPGEWNMVFRIDVTDPIGVCVEKNVTDIMKKKDEYGIDDIIEKIKEDDTSEQNVKNAAINRFNSAKNWGIFSKEATPLTDLIQRGKMGVIDISVYASAAGGFDIRGLVIGLVCRRLMEQRMVVRKLEELSDVQKSTTYFSKSRVDYKQEAKKQVPVVWVFVDEAHEFLPPKPAKTLATDPLVQILREGRQPGVNLVLATQQPGKIHSDAITQSDIILSHRLTAELDINALDEIMGSYTGESLFKVMDDLPRMKGSALVMDDMGESVYPMQVRPRMTWHGGGAPEVMPKDYETEDKPDKY